MKFEDNHWYRDPSESAGTRIRLTGKSTDGRDSSTVGDIVFFLFLMVLLSLHLRLLTFFSRLCSLEH